MLLRGALVPFPTSFEGPLQRVDNQDGTVGLSCSCYHIGYEVSVPRRIHYTEASVCCIEKFGGHFNCHATLLLLLSLVHDVRKVEPGFTVLLRSFFILTQLLVSYLTQLEQQMAGESRLATVDMANDHQV